MRVMWGRTQLGFVAAGLTLAWGFFGLVDPLVMVRIVGLDVVQPRGLSEARAVFGAMFVVMGAIMLWAAWSKSVPRAYLRLPGILILAEAAGRLASIVIDNVVSPGNFVFVLVELLIGVSALFASFPGAPRRGPGSAPGPGEGPDRPDPLRAYRG